MTKRKKIILLIIISTIIIPTILIVIAPYASSSVYVFLGKTLCSIDKSSCAIFASGVSIFLDKTQYTPGSEIKITVMNTGLKSINLGYKEPKVRIYSIDQQKYVYLNTDVDTVRGHAHWIFPPGWSYSYEGLLIEYKTSSNDSIFPSGVYEASLLYETREDGQLKWLKAIQTFQIVDE